MTHRGKNVCAMSTDCANLPADDGLMCALHRAESDMIDGKMERFGDDVDPLAREGISDGNV